MVTAELCYNPYLQETTARFNEKEPGKNSRVRNYRGSKLADWVDLVPEIFREEMNGYDFELSFSGTAMDYELLEKSFAEARVDGKVNIFSNKTLADRIDKYNKIKSLIGQLRQRINRRFNAVSFFSEYDSRLNVTFYLYMVMGKLAQRKLPWPVPVTAEPIQEIGSLFETDVANMPLLFYLDSDNIHVQQENIFRMLEKNKAVPRQMFFLIDSSLNKRNTERLLKDLRIEKPQIVDSEEDACIEQYVELYPLTDYIADAVRIFSREFERINEEVKNSDVHRRIENQDIINTIKDCSSRISALKEAFDRFESRDNVKPLSQWRKYEEEFENSILSWKKRDLNVKGAYSASYWAKEIDIKVSNWFVRYFNDMEAACSLKMAEIDTQYEEWYMLADTCTDFTPEKVEFKFDRTVPQLDIPEKLMGIRHKETAVSDEDLLFMGGYSKPTFSIQNVYYFNEWRKEILETVRPVLSEKYSACYDFLKSYSDNLCSEYESQIQKLIGDLDKKRESFARNLSSEEKRIQNEYEWIGLMKDQMADIERR